MKQKNRNLPSARADNGFGAEVEFFGATTTTEEEEEEEAEAAAAEEAEVGDERGEPLPSRGEAADGTFKAFTSCAVGDRPNS